MHLQVFLAKVLNHMLPSLTLGSIESKWVSRDKKQVWDKCWWARVASYFVIELSGMWAAENRVCEVSRGKRVWVKSCTGFFFDSPRMEVLHTVHTLIPFQALSRQIPVCTLGGLYCVMCNYKSKCLYCVTCRTTVCCLVCVCVTNLKRIHRRDRNTHRRICTPLLARICVCERRLWFFCTVGVVCERASHLCVSASIDTAKPAFAETVCSNNRIPRPAASASHRPLEEVVLWHVSGTRTDATDSTDSIDTSKYF